MNAKQAREQTDKAIIDTDIKKYLEMIDSRVNALSINGSYQYKQTIYNINNYIMSKIHQHYKNNGFIVGWVYNEGDYFLSLEW